jgi:type III restriction enzyme
MKLKFKTQAYQSHAVESVVDCFAGQPKGDNLAYRMDPGRDLSTVEFTGFKNADLRLTPAQMLANVRTVQQRQHIDLSNQVDAFSERDAKGHFKPMEAKTRKLHLAASPFQFNIEMETGTGKTYCYIKSIFELNRRYGWSKFIIVVPSIAIREGVEKSFQITAEHFSEGYGKKARCFIYNSKQLHQLESFSSDAGINVMIINIQAFASQGADNRRIYDELDDFQSRKPIDVISSNRPILILDEPQKMEGKATVESLAKFKPLFILRYSATHRTQHNLIHRLDALDAYNQKLVKKIGVRGIQTKGLSGTSAYLYLESIEISATHPPIARLELEQKLKSGSIKRTILRIGKGDNLKDKSNGLAEYDGFVVSDIDARVDTISFTNGVQLTVGDASCDPGEEHLRRIQIREAIRAHLDKERELFNQGIKVLSLFFIDEVAKYRDYDAEDEKGEYARVFEQEYQNVLGDYLDEFLPDNEAYREFLRGIPVETTHQGYFSIDKKNRLTNPKVAKRGESAGLSDDVDAYDLILKDKESLLGLPGPHDDAETLAKRRVRFIFSHSALREGWDNPNVFVLCMLKHSDNTISRRQEVGRGLRICVDQEGSRVDDPATVHQINKLTVVVSESYRDFVGNLQREMVEAIAARPRQANEAFFTGKVISTESGDLTITPAMAKAIERYLLKNDFIDDGDLITTAYHKARDADTLPPLPEDLQSHAQEIIALIDTVFSEKDLPQPEDDRKPKTNPLNANFKKKEFQELWQRINCKAIYKVDFDSQELIGKAIDALDRDLKVTPLQHIVERGEQNDQTSHEELKDGKGFRVQETENKRSETYSVHSQVTYDLLGELAEATKLTRRTIAAILQGISPATFACFKQNPEHFLAETARLINEQKATVIIERLSYDPIDDHYDTDIFTAPQVKEDFTKASQKLQRHIYDYVITDSKIERDFVTRLDTSTDVVVYAKLPRGFHIPTPVGNYNPDWAISFKEGAVKHIYFIAETKGSMSTLQLRDIEKSRIACARKFFKRLNRDIDSNQVQYGVIDSYDRLMDVITSDTIVTESFTDVESGLTAAILALLPADGALSRDYLQVAAAILVRPQIGQGILDTAVCSRLQAIAPANAAMPALIAGIQSKQEDLVMDHAVVRAANLAERGPDWATQAAQHPLPWSTDDLRAVLIATADLLASSRAAARTPAQTAALRELGQLASA